MFQILLSQRIHFLLIFCVPLGPDKHKMQNLVEQGVDNEKLKYLFLLFNFIIFI